MALRIVVNKNGEGKDLDQMSVEEQITFTAFIKNLVLDSLKLFFYPHIPIINDSFYDKNNGYKSWHIDVNPKKDNLLKFEIQIKSRLWHEIAQDGGAAHYLYLNNYSDREFLDSIKKCYHQLIAGKKNY